MKSLHSHNLQQLIDDLTQELSDCIESREVSIITGDINMERAWDEQIDNIVKFCKDNSNKLGL
jgi:hypothetical protein